VKQVTAANHLGRLTSCLIIFLRIPAIIPLLIIMQYNPCKTHKVKGQHSTKEWTIKEKIRVVPAEGEN